MTLTTKILKVITLVVSLSKSSGHEVMSFLRFFFLNIPRKIIWKFQILTRLSSESWTLNWCSSGSSAAQLPLEVCQSVPTLLYTLKYSWARNGTPNLCVHTLSAYMWGIQLCFKHNVMFSVFWKITTESHRPFVLFYSILFWIFLFNPTMAQCLNAT